MDEAIRVLERRVLESSDDDQARSELARARRRAGQAPVYRFLEMKTVDLNNIRIQVHPNLAFDMMWLHRALRPGARALVFGHSQPPCPVCDHEAHRRAELPELRQFEPPPRYAFCQPRADFPGLMVRGGSPDAVLRGGSR